MAKHNLDGKEKTRSGILESLRGKEEGRSPTGDHPGEGSKDHLEKSC